VYVLDGVWNKTLGKVWNPNKFVNKRKYKCKWRERKNEGKFEKNTFLEKKVERW